MGHKYIGKREIKKENWDRNPRDKKSYRQWSHGGQGK